MEKLNGIKAALIDMDGTLYDSMPNHARAWMEVCRHAGLKAREADFFLLEGSTGANTINLLTRRSLGRDATEAEMADLYALKCRYFAAQPPVAVMPGARRLIDELHRRGITTVLVTGSGQNTLLDRLESDFPGAFPPERRVTSRNVSRGKPAPDPYLRGLELAGVDAARAIAIDNAPLGTQSARAAGIFTVGVVTGPIEASDLLTNGADIVYASMAECADALPQLL